MEYKPRKFGLFSKSATQSPGGAYFINRSITFRDERSFNFSKHQKKLKSIKNPSQKKKKSENFRENHDFSKTSKFFENRDFFNTVFNWIFEKIEIFGNFRKNHDFPGNFPDFPGKFPDFFIF